MAMASKIRNHGVLARHPKKQFLGIRERGGYISILAAVVEDKPGEPKGAFRNGSAAAIGAAEVGKIFAIVAAYA